MRTRFISALFLIGFTTIPAVAHPLPNFRYDRHVDVRLHAQSVEIRYTLQVSFWTIFTDSQKLFTPQEIEAMGGKLTQVTKSYCEKMGPLMAAKLDARLDTIPLTFRVTKLEVQQDREHGEVSLRVSGTLARQWRRHAEFIRARRSQLRERYRSHFAHDQGRYEDL